MSAKDMDGFMGLLSTTDTKQKLVIGQDLLNYLQKGSSIECSDIGMVVDSLLPWIQSSNFKVSQMGLDLMTELVRRMEGYFKPYIPTVIPPVVDRLGDSKELVRDRCQLLLSTLMEVGAITPQHLWDRLAPAFAHKNSNVRDEIMKCLTTTLNQHGANTVCVSRLVPSLVKLLSDPNAAVRDNAQCTIANVYRHVGERLRADLVKKHQLPPTKAPNLMAKLDEIKAAGDFFPTAHHSASLLDEDETDRSAPPSATKRSASVTRKNVTSSASKPTSHVPAPSSCTATPSSVPNSASKFSRTGSLRKPSAAGSGPAGAVDEDGFIKAFHDVPNVQIFSVRDLEDTLNKVRTVIADPNQEWNKRVDAIKKIRSLLIAGASSYEEFYNHLRLLDVPFQISVKELRSQVVREACVTLAFMSQHLTNRFEHFAENLVPVLINLIQNSAKIIASAGQVCIGFIVRYTHSSRLVPHICSGLSSKSREIRRAACKFLHIILSTWSGHILTKHSALLQSSVASAIADADQEVRGTARKAYWAFKDQFPNLAESLLDNLDANYKRSLHSDMSNSSSSNSLHHQPTSISRRQEAVTPLSKRIPIGSPRTASPRSNSAIDLQAAQRAKARAQYAALARQKVGSNTSLPRPKKTGTESGPSSLAFSPEHTRQGRSRTTGISQSQPSSRSGSPSSRLNYATYSSCLGERSRRSPSYTTRSTQGSRETSPSRYNPLPPLGKLRGVRPPLSRPVMAHKILQQSLEAESALADALGYTDGRGDTSGSCVTSPRRLRLDDHSDDSETSSVCSERSFESHRRPSDSYSWSGSQQRLYRDMWEPAIKDINEIMEACESTHWSDRKDGLVSLSAYLQAGNTLSPHQLNRITENFTKMLSDTHTKVFSLFLDTVSDLVSTHSADLHPWLYILLTRLFNKLGGDLLSSIQTKIQKTLGVVKSSFGPEPLLHWALRFLVDPTQTPNTRVKLAVLGFIAKLAPAADPASAFPPPSPSSSGQSKDVTTTALTKMIGWTMGEGIKQGGELRRGAQEAILALFNLNTPQVTLRLSQLPKEYQEAAGSLIRMRRGSGGGGDSLSPDQVYRSLRRTTAEIQSYSYDTNGGNKVADTASHDSGISQMSDKHDDILWGMSSLSLSSPTRSGKDYNGLETTDSPTSLGNGFSKEGGNSESGDALSKLLDTIENSSGAERKAAFDQLATLIRESDPITLNTHFRKILKGVLGKSGLLGEADSRLGGLTALSEVMKRKCLWSSLQTYVELILLRVIDAYSDGNKEVSKLAEQAALLIISALDPADVIRVLVPLMRAEEFPKNLMAIKTLTKLVELETKEVILPFLPDIMPGLVQAYANEESLVRKSTVFCMVALHNKLGGETLKPYLASLNASKLKLLHLYINRTQTDQSPSSPKPAAAV